MALREKLIKAYGLSVDPLVASDKDVYDAIRVAVATGGFPQENVSISYIGFAGQVSYDKPRVNEAAGTISVTVKAGIDVTSIGTFYVLDDQGYSTADIAEGTEVDYTSPVVFTVTAEDGTTTKAYTITVTVAS